MLLLTRQLNCKTYIEKKNVKKTRPYSTTAKIRRKWVRCKVFGDQATLVNQPWSRIYKNSRVVTPSNSLSKLELTTM